MAPATTANGNRVWSVCGGDRGASRRLQPAEFSAALGKRAPIMARIAPALNEIMEMFRRRLPLDKEEERMRLFDAISQFLSRFRGGRLSY